MARAKSVPATTLLFHDRETFRDCPIQFENIKWFEPKRPLKGAPWTRIYSVVTPPKYWDVDERVDTVVATLWLHDQTQALQIFSQCRRPLKTRQSAII